MRAKVKRETLPPMWSVLSRDRSRKRSTDLCASRFQTAGSPCFCSTCRALPKHRVNPRQPRLCDAAARGLSHDHHPNGSPFVAAQEIFHPHHRPSHANHSNRGDSNNITAAKESKRRLDWGILSSFTSIYLSPCGPTLTTTIRSDPIRSAPCPTGLGVPSHTTHASKAHVYQESSFQPHG